MPTAFRFGRVSVLLAAGATGAGAQVDTKIQSTFPAVMTFCLPGMEATVLIRNLASDETGTWRIVYLPTSATSMSSSRIELGGGRARSTMNSLWRIS